MSILLNDGIGTGIGLCIEIGLTSLRPVLREKERMQPSKGKRNTCTCILILIKMYFNVYMYCVCSMYLASFDCRKSQD